jgi:hypothetical protein
MRDHYFDLSLGDTALDKTVDERCFQTHEEDFHE